MIFPKKQSSVLPGFGLTMGFTLAYLSLIVLIPLSMLLLKTASLTWSQFWATVTDEQVQAAYKLSFGASLLSALINAVFGLLVAWVLVRYRFPGKRILDGLVDLPFALPTAVAGISLTAVYANNGWLGQYLEPHGINVAYTPLGVLIALIFVGLPFAVRTVQPILEDLDLDVEEAAASLGASRWQTFRRVLLPPLVPAVLTGFALAFARALGEYGSVIFISGNLPYQTEIAPQLIVVRLNDVASGDRSAAEAAAIAVVLLVFSFVLLACINFLERWGKGRGA